MVDCCAKSAKLWSSGSRCLKTLVDGTPSGTGRQDFVFTALDCRFSHQIDEMQ